MPMAAILRVNLGMKDSKLIQLAQGKAKSSWPHLEAQPGLSPASDIGFGTPYDEAFICRNTHLMFDLEFRKCFCLKLSK